MHVYVLFYFLCTSAKLGNKLHSVEITSVSHIAYHTILVYVLLTLTVFLLSMWPDSLFVFNIKIKAKWRDLSDLLNDLAKNVINNHGNLQ